MDMNVIYISNIEPTPAPIPVPAPVPVPVPTTSYWDLGRCLRCGSPAHWVKNCPQPKPNPKAVPLNMPNGYRLWVENDEILDRKYGNSNSDSE